jgi:hypothetical protein
MNNPAYLMLLATLVVACGPSSVRPGNNTDGAADDRGIDGRASACTSDECGPAPQMARSVQCTDGTVAGPVCNRYPSGKCAWSLVPCDDSTSCPGQDPCGPSPPDGFCLGLGNYSVCFTDDNGGCSWEVICADLPG